MTGHEVAGLYEQLSRSDQLLVSDLVARLSGEERAPTVRERLEAVAKRCEHINDLGPEGSPLFGSVLSSRLSPVEARRFAEDLRRRADEATSRRDHEEVVFETFDVWEEVAAELGLDAGVVVHRYGRTYHRVHLTPAVAIGVSQGVLSEVTAIG